MGNENNSQLIHFGITLERVFYGLQQYLNINQQQLLFSEFGTCDACREDLRRIEDAIRETTQYLAAFTEYEIANVHGSKELSPIGKHILKWMKHRAVKGTGARVSDEVQKINATWATLVHVGNGSATAAMTEEACRLVKELIDYSCLASLAAEPEEEVISAF